MQKHHRKPFPSKYSNVLRYEFLCSETQKAFCMHSDGASMAGALVRFPSSARPPPACPRMGQAAIDAVGGGRMRLLSVLLLGASRLQPWGLGAAERAIFISPLQLRSSALPALPTTHCFSTSSHQHHLIPAPDMRHPGFLPLLFIHPLPCQGHVFLFLGRARSRPRKWRGFRSKAGHEPQRKRSERNGGKAAGRKA